MKFLLNLFSFNTYTISPDSLKNQFQDIQIREVEINNPFDYNRSIKYYGNTIKKLEVIDKNGKKLRLENSPSLEMRITIKKGKRYVVYFDTITIENNILTGDRSRFLPNFKKEIPLENIIKIEIQNGRKHFHYKK